MNGTYISIFGLTFESALKICTEFEEWELIGKKHRVFSDREVDLELQEGHYRLTCVDEYLHIEQLEKIIDETGKEKWKVIHKLSIEKNSFAKMIVK